MRVAGSRSGSTGRRFATPGDVVDHRDAAIRLGLTAGQRADPVEFLNSL